MLLKLYHQRVKIVGTFPEKEMPVHNVILDLKISRKEYEWMQNTKLWSEKVGNQKLPRIQVTES